MWALCWFSWVVILFLVWNKRRLVFFIITFFNFAWLLLILLPLFLPLIFMNNRIDIRWFVMRLLYFMLLFAVLRVFQMFWFLRYNLFFGFRLHNNILFFIQIQFDTILLHFYINSWIILLRLIFISRFLLFLLLNYSLILLLFKMIINKA